MDGTVELTNFNSSHPNEEKEVNNGYDNAGYNAQRKDSYIINIDETQEPNLNGETKIQDPTLAHRFASKITEAQNYVEVGYSSRKSCINWCIVVFMTIAYFVYFYFAMAYEFGSTESITLLWVTCLVVFGVLVSIVQKYCGKRIADKCGGYLRCCDANGHIILWIVLAVIYAVVIVFIFVDVFHTTKEPYNLVSLAGLILYVLITFVFSYSPGQVKWRTVLWGIALQFSFALFILRWPWGYQVFEWLGDVITNFLANSDYGAEFVFGENFRDHFFAFSVLPVVVFFSSFISILYYLGVMQVAIRKVSWVLQTLMGTTAGESVNAAGNIFVSQNEAPLLIRPLVKDMTRSELHAVLTGGFATIAGSVLAGYIMFGVPANHLVSASVMSAPAALAIAKLFYPETEISKTTSEDVKAMEPSTDRNIIEAAGTGAAQSIKMVANIAANLIAFIALLAFVNNMLTWFGLRVGWDDPPLTFELICSYLFYPLALIMGTSIDDCRNVGELIGVKIFVNEFVAYERLGILISNRDMFESHTAVNGSYEYVSDDIILYDYVDSDGVVSNATVLEKGIMTDRSEVISTYALCGFANISSIGIMMGVMGAIAPSRKSDIASVVVRAMIAGNIACFMTACIAGLFYQGDI